MTLPRSESTADTAADVGVSTAGISAVGSSPGQCYRDEVAHICMAEPHFEPEQLENEVVRPEFGAVVCFVGRVRNHTVGIAKPVTDLQYTAHPQAHPQLVAVAREIQQRLGAECAVSVAHRLGTAHVGDPVFVVAVGAAHRHQAFEVCAAIVSEVKAQVPIWKRELFADGSASWPGID